MDKATAKRLAEKYSMGILRNPITSEAWGVIVETDELIPELDKYADADLENYMGNNTAIVERTYNGSSYTYKIVCPTRWFDLWGWR